MAVPGGAPEPRLVATMGVFDGVHRGHRALLEVVLQRARALGLPALAITFDPHPVSVLSPSASGHILTPREVKLRLFAELGLDRVWVLPFSSALAALEPGVFLERLLLRHIALEEFWVGYDFRFGRGRAGDVNLLRGEGARLGFRVQQFGPVHQGGRVLSSSRVRDSLRGGRIEEAVDVLGHTFVLEGMVVPGRGEGAKVLVPTANLELHRDQCLPANGVYSAWAEVGGRLHPSVVNVGTRPTLTRDTKPTVEAHVMDWEDDLRGAGLALHLDQRLRPERRFPDLTALQQAVAGDIARARSRLEGRVPRQESSPEN